MKKIMKKLFVGFFITLVLYGMGPLIVNLMEPWPMVYTVNLKLKDGVWVPVGPRGNRPEDVRMRRVFLAHTVNCNIVALDALVASFMLLWILPDVRQLSARRMTHLAATA